MSSRVHTVDTAATEIKTCYLKKDNKNIKQPKTQNPSPQKKKATSLVTVPNLQFDYKKYF